MTRCVRGTYPSTLERERARAYQIGGPEPACEIAAVWQAGAHALPALPPRAGCDPLPSSLGPAYVPTVLPIVGSYAYRRVLRRLAGAHARPALPPRAGCEPIAGSARDRYSAGPSIRPIFTRRCFIMTNMIQVCSNFHSARVFIIDTGPDEKPEIGPIPVESASIAGAIESVLRIADQRVRATFWPWLPGRSP